MQQKNNNNLFGIFRKKTRIFMYIQWKFVRYLDI